MLDLGGIDVREIATALADQTDYDHRWLIDPRTGEVAFWTSDTGIDGSNPIEIDELDLIPIDPVPSYMWFQDMADFADGISDSAAGRRLAQALQGRGAFRRFKNQLYEHHPGLIPPWHVFRDVRAQRRAVEYLLDQGLIAASAAKQFATDHPTQTCLEPVRWTALEQPPTADARNQGASNSRESASCVLGAQQSRSVIGASCCPVGGDQLPRHMSPDDHLKVPFPYTYDQVIEAMASTRGAGAHFVLLMYLEMNTEEVGVERFRRLLDSTNLRGQEKMSVRLSLAKLDRTHAAELATVLRSARSLESQQMLLANLPDFLPREPIAAVADELEAWILRRVQRPTYLEFGASWEIPSAVLGVLHTSTASRARQLLTDLDAHLDPPEQHRVHLAIKGNDTALEATLEEWRALNGTERRPYSAKEFTEALAEQEREAIKVMRRLGYHPGPAN